MKKGKAIFLSVAVILGAGGLIFGNYMLASSAFAAGGTQEHSIVMPELSTVAIQGDENDEVYLTMASHSDIEHEAETSPVTSQSSENGILSEEEAKQIGINAITEKFGLTQKELELFEVGVSVRYPVDDPTEDTQVIYDADVFLWSVKLTPFKQSDFPTIDYYFATFDNRQEELMLVNIVPLIREGTPPANEITADKAQELAVTAIVEKYALTQETLDRFTITTKYFEVTNETPGKRSWWVNLYPTNIDDYSEIGCYWSYIDAETGDVLQLNSAVDGKG